MVVVMTVAVLICLAFVVAFFLVVAVRRAVVAALGTVVGLVVAGTRMPGFTAGGAKSTLAGPVALARGTFSAREADASSPRRKAVPVHVLERREAINKMHMHARFARAANRSARAMAAVVLGRCYAGRALFVLWAVPRGRGERFRERV